ncbi:MAG TPA: endo-1,4-beta-xylanase, partial [Opitutaceae bacterium]|nr:endo-1,4-beta-xylanase [Opitutaceae bacterium]
MNPHAPRSSSLRTRGSLPLSPRRAPRLAAWLTALAVACAVTAKAFTPSGPPMANGQTKFLGSCYSTSQTANFAAYFNQVTPENAGKWGSVEQTRDVMNWTQLDEAYNFAKANGMKFRFHILVWGSQQPSWISALSTAEKLDEIKEWFAAVAARYPDLDYVEVVNEPLHAPPNGGQIAYSNPAVYAANYSDALGGAGTSGWEWLVQSFRLARQYFPGKKLVLNEYGLLNDSYSVSRYVQIVNLLKAENLVDVIATQAHAFETYGVPTQTLTNNLATLAATGLPIMITEMDIDGPTDQAQLDEYKRVFPIFWNHPSVIGITLWGYRPGLWRNAQGAYLVLADNTERPAMQWLKTFVGNFPPVVTASQIFPVQTSAVNGTVVGTVLATDANAGTTLQGWAITGGTGASYFAINATTGQVTVSNRAGLDLAGVESFTLQVTVGDGIATSTAGTVTILTPASAPTATAQPAAAAVAVGANASFTFGVSSPIAFTRQWQFSSDGGATWNDLANGGVYSSVASDTLHITGATMAMNGYRFRCVATNLAGTATSAGAMLTVSSGMGSDFNYDGSADLVWQNTSTGERKIWLMNGTSKGSEVSLGNVPVEWQIAGTADFNGDGKTDILWQNSSTGERGV